MVVISKLIISSLYLVNTFELNPTSLIINSKKFLSLAISNEIDFFSSGIFPIEIVSKNFAFCLYLFVLIQNLDLNIQVYPKI